MAIAQKIIMRYVYQNYIPGTFHTTVIGKDRIKVTNFHDKDVTLTLNLYADIMDAETEEIYAVSDLPHDLRVIGNRIPESWQKVECRGGA